MIDFRQAKFLLSANSQKTFLSDRPIVVIIGRSNAGKSTLVNTLCDNKKLMKVSKEAGRTRLLNYLDIQDKYYLVDAPGYGYAGALNFIDMLAEFFSCVKGKIKAVYLLLDPRRKLQEDDFDLFEMISSYKLNMKIVFSKMDKLNSSERKVAEKVRNTTFSKNEVFYVSSLTKMGIEELRKDIAKSFIA
ncbi:MAG TPA: ribosome biogenesis GTP-binding protein YsxC [Firmicutes bacterium]|nr:ribosome biogenesis GTP-binding protein YsxC [Bacillota bacterium]